MILPVIENWKRVQPRLESLSVSRWFYPVALLLIGLLTYAYQIASLGFYWDDWEVVFLLNAKSPALLHGYFAFDRPFAWPYQVMYAAFGLSPVAWHLATLLLRWGGVLLFYLSLKQIWPRLEGLLRWLGALLLVYPGFFQQSTSAAYNRHFTAFFLFMLSIYLMVLAVRQPRRAWWLLPLSWIAGFLQIFTIEYFAGLELVRPAILWLLIREQGRTGTRQAMRKTLMIWLPFVGLFALYLWWRLALFPATISTREYAGDFKMLADFQSSYLAGLMALLTRFALDLLYSVVQVWTAGLTAQAGFTFLSKAAWFALALGAVVAALFAAFQRATASAENDGTRPRRELFLLGAWTFLVSGLPVWLTSRQLSGSGRWDDRFALAMMFGAVLMAGAAIWWLVQEPRRRLVLSLLLLLSVAAQALIVNRYRLDWQEQRDYYWQLYWRAPALQPGTAVISFEQPSMMVPGYDTSYALNVLYGGNASGGSMPYWFFTNDHALNFDLVPGKRISYTFRNLEFKGSTSDAIAVIHQGENRCLQVLDGAYAGEPFYEEGQELLPPLSNVSRIGPEAAGPPNRQVFGAEPPHGWCYFFEKADLARQMGDWETVLKLEKQARAQGFAPGFGAEYVPFVEAHARTGDWQKAYDLSLAAQKTVKDMEPLLCSTWARLAQLPGADTGFVDQAKQSFACSTP
jgi:hypothetical protein